MTLGGPKHVWWWVSLVVWAGVILGILGLVGRIWTVPGLSGVAFWLLAIGWVILAAAAGVIYLRLPRTR